MTSKYDEMPATEGNYEAEFYARLGVEPDDEFARNVSGATDAAISFARKYANDPVYAEAMQYFRDTFERERPLTLTPQQEKALSEGRLLVNGHVFEALTLEQMSGIARGDA